MRVNYLNKSEIKIDENEILRYLGYKNKKVDKETQAILKEALNELYEFSQLKYVYKIFEITKTKNTLCLEDQINIRSKDLYKLFINSEKTAVFAASLGFYVERKIQYYSKINLSKAIIFDACATAYIEALCDYIESEIREIAQKEGQGITYRFSPGYGDLPLHHQKEILSVLEADKLIGLSCSPSSLLIPRKSVTAFIGFTKDKVIRKKQCINCNRYKDCQFSKKGEKSCDK